MPLKPEVICPNGSFCLYADTDFHCYHFIDQQKRRTVRNYLHNFFLVHSSVCHPAPPPFYSIASMQSFNVALLMI